MDDSITKVANDTIYNDVSLRIDIYFHNLRGHFEARYQDTLKLIEKFMPPGKKILEIGSNIGFTLNIAKNNGYNVTGCELNDKCREISKLLWDIPVEKDFFEIKEKYDVIIMCDVLEHLPDPSAALKKIHSLLNDKGLLFIQLPNRQSEFCLKLKEKWPFWCVPDHRFHFTVKSLSALCAKNGFVEKSTRTVGLYTKHFIWKLIYPRRLRKVLLRIMDSILKIGFRKINGLGEEIIQMVAIRG
ncbi:MAG: class I SAM-dependent methyltransferase [Fibromonadaceae bacterium]|nr:class I SAM-dependent methyltransferase [Fibromonadaceae bacterium]